MDTRRLPLLLSSRNDRRTDVHDQQQYQGSWESALFDREFTEVERAERAICVSAKVGPGRRTIACAAAIPSSEQGHQGVDCRWNGVQL